MALARERVRFPGKIRGNDLIAACTIEAWKVTDRASGSFSFIEYHPINVMPKRPAGEYEIEANGEVHKVRLTDQGFWIAAP